ncbi:MULTISPECIES: cell division protein ZipA C-terminal FtsZ-binding domain-containing protein [unclassified Pseudoalteromonas]|uniref:cell division protein ZipA C-terminal FtsZ-binding domain-containing protein n=1 Tax=unclassified Pseudoalteromonas TaxID=194690 RepID=UPI0005A69116|nr:MULTISPECIES: cell division protein ZipA C-terminal FtsZ-binding domain-containing protein [unclassified Pseudoalteromonas]
MAEELRWVLVIISALVIGGLLLHGIWSVRKKDETPSGEAKINTSSKEQAPSVEIADESMDVPSMVADRDEPEIGDISVQLDEDDDVKSATDKEASGTQETPEAEEPKDFIIVHIQMPTGLTMQGSSLLPLLLTLGFKYSDEGFFNRHKDPSGDGPVLFRLVNMFNPGTFDIDNMEQFSTAGISLFMTLPCEGDTLPAFNMLHSAAKKIADEFGAEIFDHKRELLTVPTVRQYVEKIREFG